MGIIEEVRVSGEQLVDEIKRLIHEGNVQHIVIKDSEGKTVFEIPVNAGLIGALLLPLWAAVAAVAVVASNYTIVVTRTDEPGETPTAPPAE